MSLTEKWRPKTGDELIGNPKGIAKLKEALEDGSNVFLHGDPGTGKTSAVHALARDLGMRVMEMNASDARRKDELEALLGRVKMQGLRPFIVLLDEVDGIKNWPLMQKVMVNSRHPVVLVANDAYKVPGNIKKMCVNIRFYRPRAAEVVERVKHIAQTEGLNVKYGEVTGDVRSSINAVMYGGEGYELEDKFGLVNHALSGGVVELSEEDYVWLMDNFHRYYNGRDLYEACKLLSVAARSRPGVLASLPRGKGRMLYPYYLRRISVLGRKKND